MCSSRIDWRKKNGDVLKDLWLHFWVWIYHLSRTTYAIVSKENTKWDTSRCYVVKSCNSFSQGVNKQLCAYSKRGFCDFFFQSLLSGWKRHLIRVRNYGTLFGRRGIHSNAHHIIFSICFEFTMPKEHFCDVCNFSFSLLLLKMSFKSLININQQSKEETLICAIWWYKSDIDKDIPKQFYTKISFLI